MIDSCAELTSDKYFAEVRRKLYTTPKSYLDLIRLYISLLGEQQAALEKRISKMISGVRKVWKVPAIRSCEQLVGDPHPLVLPF